MHIYYLLSR